MDMMFELLCAVFFAALCPLDVRTIEGNATRYHHGDGHSGETLGCVSAARKYFGSAQMRDDIMGVALRDEYGIRCGQPMVIVHGNKWTIARRIDSGPFGCYSDGGDRIPVAKKCPRGYHRRSIVDMLPAVADALGHSGWGNVTIYSVRN